MKAFLAITVFLTALVNCFAQPVAYGRTPVSIKVGVVILASTSGPGGQPTNADPYVFFNLDRRSDMKPPGWDFENPLQSSTMTQRQADRWNAITGTTQFSPGAKVTKNMAMYWEVELTQISTKDITQYNVLMIHAPGNINLNTVEREKLEAFIDAGGILWFDESSVQSVDGQNGFPVPFVTSNTGNNPYVTQIFHPILNYPYKIDYYEAAYMGAHRGGHSILAATLPSGYETVLADMNAGFGRFNQVIRNSNGMVLGVANIGNGYFVGSSSNIVSRINEPAGGTNVGLGPNSGPYAGTNFLNIPITELKFAYNMISLAGQHTSLSKGSRRNNSSFDDVGAPLLETWSDSSINLSQGNDTVYVPPAIYKNVVFVTAGSKLYAYKADPNQDLDGDGWNDDGFQDASAGAKSDLIWRSTDLPTPLSSPVAIEVANPGSGIPKDQVYVVDGTGRLVVFDAFPKNAQGRLLGPNPINPVTAVSPPGAPAVLNTTEDARGPYTPVAFDGVMYVYDAYLGNLGQTLGRIWAVDTSSATLVTTGGTPWSCSGTGVPNLPEPGGSPTAGYIPNTDGSGGLDAVMYVSNHSTLTAQSSGVSSIWIGAKGESPTVTRTPTSIDVVTRAASRGLRLYDQPNSRLGIHVYLVDDNLNGAPVDATVYLDGTLTQFAPGQIKLGLRQPLPGNVGVRIDYRIDWGTGSPNMVAQLIRGQLFMPDDINRTRYVVKSMALAPNGNLFVVTGDEQNSGTLFAINEYTRGGFKLVYRWDLYDQINITLNGTQTVRWGPALIDQDFLVTNIIPFLNQPFRRMHFHGSPTIINNVVYLSASGQKAAFGGPRATIIMAFDANPTRTDVRLGAPIPTGFRMRQPDIAASSNKQTPERSVSLQPDQADLQTAGGVVRFNNNMSGITGDMRNAFSSSLPVIVAGSGQPETLLDPDATGSKWSPLLWYFVINGYVNESPPLVLGNTVYEAGGTVLYRLMTGQIPIPQPSLFAMDAEIPPNDPSILTIPGRPGLHQSRWLYPALSVIGFTGNPHVRWPSGEGIRSISDFRIRLQQTLLSNSNNIYALGVVGGDGAVVAWAQDGIFGFRKATTVVADEGRVIETDAGGFMQWSTDLSYQAALNGGATLIQTKKLVRPTKVYKTAENEYTIVDTGGDRIARIDKGAGEVRSIEKVSLDLTYRPNGWQEGEEQNLRQPRDVAQWGDYVPQGNNRFTGPAPTGLEYWVHYLIADTGNRRMVELVDRYAARFDNNLNTYIVGDVIRDASGEPQLGKLVWHTPQNFSGKTWQYTAIQRFQVGIDQVSGNAQFVYIGAVGDTLPTRIDTGLDVPTGTGLRETGGGEGGLVIFDSVTPAGNQVINQVRLPNGNIKRLIGINSISVRPLSISNNVVNYAILFTDNTGVYEIAKNGNNWDVIWMLPNSVYETIRLVKLRATSAKRLQNGDVLITNAYFGKTNPVGPPQNIPARDFNGEVTQWNGSTFDVTDPSGLLGFTTASIKFILPPIVGSRALRNPQFADRL